MIDLDATLARVVELCDAISGITGASDEYPTNPLDAADLPFFFVSEGRATYTSITAQSDRVEQEYILLLYAATFKDGDEAGEQIARETARDFLQPVHRYFLARPRLHKTGTDQGLNSVERARLTGHDGPQSASRDGKLYYGVAFRLSVQYEESLD